MPVNLRCLDAATRRKTIGDAMPTVYEFSRIKVDFRHDDSARSLISTARLPLEYGQIVTTILMVERWVEADGGEVDRC